VITTPAAIADGQHVMRVVPGCTGLTIKDNNLQLTGDGSTPAMDLQNVEDLTERQNKVTWSDE